MEQKTFVHLVLVLAVAILVMDYGFTAQRGVPQTSVIPVQQLVGNDRDLHGCIGSAGYSWCGAKQKCLRTWEEACEVKGNATITAEWRVYRNDTYGFEIKYPNTWEKRESINTKGNPDRLWLSGVYTTSTGESSSSLGLEIFSSQMSLKEAKSVGDGDLELFSTILRNDMAGMDYAPNLRDTSFNGIPAKEVPEGRVPGKRWDLPDEGFDIIFIKDRIGYHFSGWVRRGGKLETAKEILSTFKFTK